MVIKYHFLAIRFHFLSFLGGMFVFFFFFFIFWRSSSWTAWDRVFSSFSCVIIIISFRKLDLTSQTCNICNILSPLYHAYFQQIALAVFKFVTHCLIWDFFCRVSCWTPGHGQKERGSYERGAVLYLSVCPIVCLSSRLAVSFLRIGSFVFSET